MKKTLLGMLMIASLLVTTSTAVWAGELDILLEKLVDKGVLTPVEADIIKDETKQQVAAEVTAGKSYAAPQWVQKMKIKGDLRLRYQYNKKNHPKQEIAAAFATV